MTREEMPSADSCGDPFQEKQIEGFLPVGCGAEPVFNYSWKKEITPYGSGDDDNSDLSQPVTLGTTMIPFEGSLSTETDHRTTQPTEVTEVGIVLVTHSRSTSRRPPRFTPSPENRHSSFQHLLRIHLNTFNQRLSMLESNTLDMKASIRSMEDQQSHLSSQLKDLIAIHSVREKDKKVTELEKSYADMDTRLTRLEGRLEILIDGFTALAQEMNKMKRARHTSRSPQERRLLPPLTTVLTLTMYTTHQPSVRVIPTKSPVISKATVPKSIPTPGLPAKKAPSTPQRQRKLKPAATTKPHKNTAKSQPVTSTSSPTKLKTATSKPRTASKIKPKTPPKPKTTRPSGRRSAVTPKGLQPSQTRTKQTKVEETVTKFQLDPPSHKSNSTRNPQVHKQTNKREPSLPIQSSGRKRVFSSDAPIPPVQESGKPPEGDPKKASNSNHNERKSARNSYKLVSHKTKNFTKHSITTTKPTSAAATITKKPKTTVKRTTTPKTKVTTAAKRTPTPPKTKAATTLKKVTKKPQQKKKKNSHSGVLDLLRLLQGQQKSAKRRKIQDGSLHVVLGRLAIPIRIIPDD
ncbi:proteoglycan 4-like [Echeneis naucrates]|uniref:proteoglycan 4-like n=1 Tax=Echeneis naucrates TaxID=173247 RepID=UPI001113B136|nr:proteoglycan 4-like [Echeneis naucrates]